jgi:hypothetical protein
MGLLGFAAVGALGLAVCVAALLWPRFRQLAQRALMSGADAGLLALAVISLLNAFVADGSDRDQSLYVQWGSVGTLAGFGFGACCAVATDLIRRWRRAA